MNIEAKETLKKEIEEAFNKYEEKTGINLLCDLESIAIVRKGGKLYNLYLHYKRKHTVI